MEKVPATAGSRLISIYSAEDGALAQAANPGDCIEIIAQLLPVQGPCCLANNQAHDQHQAHSASRLKMILPSPAQGCRGCITYPHQAPSMGKRKGGSLERKMLGISSPEKPITENILSL